MYPVTQDFQEKMKSDARRALGLIKIDYTDPFIDQSISVSANEQANVSHIAQTADAVSEPTHKWASLDGAWVLDGTYHLAPETEEEAKTLQMGWWGATLAGEDGAFAIPYPTLTVEHASRPVHSLRVVGDSKREEYPVDFEIRLYDSDNNLLHAETVTGNSEITWAKDVSINKVAKSVLEIRRWSHEGRQVKILEFFTSVQEVYEGDDIILINLLEERETSEGSLPVGNISANEIDIRLDNATRKFDAGNTQSPLYQLLKPNRRIRAWLGVEAENTCSESPPSFTRNSVAYKSDGTQVAANVPRFETGMFGQAVMVEEGTENLLTENQSSVEIDLSGIASYRATLTRTNEIKAWHGVYCVKAAHNYSTLTYFGPNTGGAKISVSPGQVFTGAAYVRQGANVSEAYVKLDWFDSSGTFVCGSFSQRVDLTEDWQRLSVTATVPDGIAYVCISPYGKGDVGSYFYVDGIQIEENPYPTSWHIGDSARASETLTIPTEGVLNPQEGTVDCWIYVGDTLKRVDGIFRVIWYAVPWGYPNAWFVLDHDGSSANWRVAVKRDGAVGKTFFIPDSHTPNGWHLFTVTYDADEGTLGLFIDGVPRLSETGVLFPDGYDAIRIGGAPDGSRLCNTLHDDLRISSRARSDEEIAAAYASGQPLPVDADTTYKLTYNGSIYPVERVWVPLGTFWSGEWSAPEDGLYAATTGRDRLDMLAQSTYNTSQVAMNVSLYELAEAVLQDAGLEPEEYSISADLQTYVVPYAWFGTISHREALRLISEASLSVAYCDRHGTIRVEPFVPAESESLLVTADDYFRKDNPAKWAEVANVIEVETQPLRPDAMQEVYRSNEPVSIESEQTLTLTVFYNEPPCIEAVAGLEDAPVGCTIEEAIYYAWGATVKVYSETAGAFVLVVTAKPLKVLNKERAVARDEQSITEHGVLRYRYPSNPLVQTLDVAELIAGTLLASFREPRRDLEMEWRGNPALLLGDRVTVTDKNEQNDYYVTRQEIEWAGALRARLSGRRV